VNSKRYKPNGKREVARRVRQIANGQLKMENMQYGLVSMFTLPGHVNFAPSFNVADVQASLAKRYEAGLI